MERTLNFPQLLSTIPIFHLISNSRQTRFSLTAFLYPFPIGLDIWCAVPSLLQPHAPAPFRIRSPFFQPRRMVKSPPPGLTSKAGPGRLVAAALPPGPWPPRSGTDGQVPGGQERVQPCTGGPIPAWPAPCSSDRMGMGSWDPAPENLIARVALRSTTTNPITSSRERTRKPSKARSLGWSRARAHCRWWVGLSLSLLLGGFGHVGHGTWRARLATGRDGAPSGKHHAVSAGWSSSRAQDDTPV